MTDTILEIGCGMGVLTKPLLAIFPHVIGIEIDERSVSYLQQVLPPRTPILHRDFMSLTPQEIRSMKLEAKQEEVPSTSSVRTSLHLISNLPYHVSKRIIIYSLKHQLFDSMVLMVQKEVALQMVKSKKTKKTLFHFWVQFWTKETELLFDVSYDICAYTYTCNVI